MTRELFTISQVKEHLSKKIGDSFWEEVFTDKYDLTTNPKGRNSKKSRSDWADITVRKLFGKERKDIIKKSRKRSTGEYNFSYIKFAQNESGKIFAIVHGKSSFHCKYPSDVWFYAFDDVKKKELEEFFKNNGLKWYTEKIIIIKNKDCLECKESYYNEGQLKKWFNTFD